MDINKCPNCQKQFDQDRRVAKQLPCGCLTCLKCQKTVFQLIQEIRCKVHQQVYSINPEQLQTFVFQEPILQDLQQAQEQFIGQEQINEQCRWLQDQYVQTQNYYREIIKEIQESSQIFQHIQSLSIQQILKVLLDQFATSNNKRESLIKRLSELQVVNVAQQYAQRIGQQVPNLRQNPQGQLQYQFQQIKFEIEELKKEQLMDVQSLRENVQRCMFGMFVYLNENSSGQFLTVNEADLLLQKYFKQFKVIRGLSQVSRSPVHKKSSFQSQSIEQQLIKENQNNDQQQDQVQVSDKQQGQDLVLVKQFSVQKEISQQEQQVIDARAVFQQMEQNMMNLTNNFSFVNRIEQFCQEQIMSIVPGPHVDITFDKLLQFLNQIKNENVSIQALQVSPLNKSRLLEYPQILQQLQAVTDQQICLKLFQILNISKNQSQIQQSASNSLTMLNYMNFQFSSIDFANLDISNSDLSDTTFTNCNFSTSNQFYSPTPDTFSNLPIFHLRKLLSLHYPAQYFLLDTNQLLSSDNDKLPTLSV